MSSKFNQFCILCQIDSANLLVIFDRLIERLGAFPSAHFHASLILVLFSLPFCIFMKNGKGELSLPFFTE